MYVGSSKVIFGLAVIVVPAVFLAFAAIAMVATGWRSWLGLQKKEESPPKAAAKPAPARPLPGKHPPPPPRRRRHRK